MVNHNKCRQSHVGCNETVDAVLSVSLPDTRMKTTVSPIRTSDPETNKYVYIQNVCLRKTPARSILKSQLGHSCTPGTETLILGFESPSGREVQASSIQKSNLTPTPCLVHVPVRCTLSLSESLPCWVHS
jgi:hypothetical protein